MENKVLVKLIVPEFEQSFDVLVPVNEVIWKIKKMMVKCVSDLLGLELNQDSVCILLNKSTSEIYTNNQIVLDSDIRNATELILIFKK